MKIFTTRKGTQLGLGAFLYAFLVFLVASVTACQPPRSLEFETAQELRDFFRWEGGQIPMISAHRGGSYPGYPENSLETFEYTLSRIPAVIECDVRRTADDVLVLLHDATLDRTTVCTGDLESFTYEELKSCLLVDDQGTETNYKIPTLEEALQWADGRTVLMLDVKRGIDFESVIDEVNRSDAGDRVVIITYTPDAAAEVFAIDPDLMISATIRNEDEWQRLRDRDVPAENLIAFTGVGEPKNDIYNVLHEAGISCILGTMGNLDRQAEARGNDIYLGLIRNGADMLSTDRPFEAWEAIQPAIDRNDPEFVYFSHPNHN